MHDTDSLRVSSSIFLIGGALYVASIGTILGFLLFGGR